jgi:hypothetical protein
VLARHDLDLAGRLADATVGGRHDHILLGSVISHFCESKAMLIRKTENDRAKETKRQKIIEIEAERQKKLEKKR